MVEDTMFSGESKNIEYKVSLPDKSGKYMKTIVAFANTQGGKLIVGVDDKTHQIVGVENDVLFQLMDGIANAVSDSCVPQIIPDIEPQTVNGKTVIVVSVEAGKNRPYYLKSKGKDNGTYIRVAGTSRQAFPEKIKELEMEGARISWDELTCGLSCFRGSNRETLSGYRKVPEESRNVRTFCKERAADKLENLEAERGTASGNECLCVADIRLFFILQNTMCGIQGKRSCSVSG